MSSALLQLFVRSPDTYSERHLDKDLTIGALKSRLESITGIPYASQVLTLYSSVDGLEDGSTEKPVAELSNEAKSLEDYGAAEGYGIKVVNADPNAQPGGQFVDTSIVEKFELSQEEYEKRTDTVLPQLKARHIGRFAPPKEGSVVSHTASADQVVGARCIVLEADASEDDSRRGSIAFVGTTDFGKGPEGGEWIGVELDEPTGKNDGSVSGKRYFTCRANHGVFVRPDRVKAGDYPEIDEFGLSDEE